MSNPDETPSSQLRVLVTGIIITENWLIGLGSQSLDPALPRRHRLVSSLPRGRAAHGGYTASGSAAPSLETFNSLKN